MASCCQGWCNKQDHQSNNTSNNDIEETPHESDEDATQHIELTMWSSVVERIGIVLGNPHHQLGTIVLLAIFTFFPVFAGIPSNMENSILRRSLESNSFQCSNYATLSLSVVYVADFFIDYVSEKCSQNAFRRYTRHKDVMIDSEILVYIAGTTIVPLVSLPAAGHPQMTLIYMCTNQASLILLAGFVSILCCRYFRKYFPVWVINLGIVFMCGSTMLTPWLVNISTEVTVLRDVVYICKFLGGGVFVLYSFRWIFYDFILRMMLPFIKHSYSFVINNSDAAKRKQHTKDSMYFPIIYAMSAIICLLFISFVDASSDSNFYDTTATGLLWYDLSVLGMPLSPSICSTNTPLIYVLDNTERLPVLSTRFPP